MRERKENIMEFIYEIFGSYVILAVLGICLCVGCIIKHLVPGTEINRFIPLIMGLLGLAVNIWINGAFTPEVVLGGLISGLASTGTHQAIKQIFKKE